MSAEAAEAVRDTRFPDLRAALDKCKNFLQNFVDAETHEEKYMKILQEVANRQKKSIHIALDDLQSFEGDVKFVNSIARNARRYISVFSEAVDELMPPAEPNSLGVSDPNDVWLEQRMQRLQAARGQDDVKSGFPSELTRRYQLFLLPRSADPRRKMREIKAEDIGALVSVKGIVTRVSDVQPLITVATYTCSTCGYESYQPVTDRSYAPLVECPSERCARNETKGDLYHHTRGSRFIPFQEVRLQELHSEVPVGHIPRSINLKIMGELTRQCSPGHLVTFDGIFLPAPFTGFRAIRAGLTTETYLQVHRVTSHKKNYGEFDISEELMQEVEEESQQEDVYESLAASIAPEIYGHENIKKALLLMLVGGVTRKLGDGMRIRGDINVLLMGDPGVAKSQLLKHIAHVAPRGIYTTGKGSSGVGLTAAVIRDPVTSEMTLEGGALVLADKGICCIDEFDKMEEGDRTAIHEVMEQQTVSVAKAGITTTLNARTCILAAANPVLGRWNPNLSPEKNLGLAPALLSRFDLCFKILDRPNEDFDRSLALHVCHVHREEKHPELDFEPYSAKFLRAYVAKARSLEPHVPEELAEFIVSLYVNMRQDDGSENNDRYHDKMTNKRARFCTARLLLSILRLAQALARIKFAPEVTQEDVEEAMRLLNTSKSEEEDQTDFHAKEDAKSAVFHLFKKMCVDNHTKSVRVVNVRRKAVTSGFSEKVVDQVLDLYSDLGVWTVSGDKETVKFIPGQLD